VSEHEKKQFTPEYKAKIMMKFLMKKVGKRGGSTMLSSNIGSEVLNCVVFAFPRYAKRTTASAMNICAY
jgi:hypothetical protein